MKTFEIRKKFPAVFKQKNEMRKKEMKKVGKWFKNLKYVMKNLKLRKNSNYEKNGLLKITSRKKVTRRGGVVRKVCNS